MGASSSQDSDVLPDRLNTEPSVFKGCSVSELTAIAILAAVIWLPLSLTGAAIVGATTMGFGVAAIGVVATVVIVAGFFQKVKNGKPEGYFQVRLRVFLAKHHLVPSPFILRSGYWDIGRS